MKIELNPYIETMVLLAASSWGQNYKIEAVRQLNTLGIDGEAFYNRNCPVVERYYAAFSKQKVNSAVAQMLAEHLMTECELLPSVYLSVFWQHPSWFTGMEDIPGAEVGAAVDAAMAEVLELGHDGDFVAALEAADMPAQVKWQAMLLKQQPKKQLAMVAAAVRENLPAFEAARKKVATELDALLAEAATVLADPPQNRLVTMSLNIAPGADIVPSLAVPLGVVVLEKVVLYGLLIHRVINVTGEITRDELLMDARVLSEKSKLEILLALKGGDMYGGEIATRIGLTAATVSHHMNTLLATGFVTLRRHGGKTYYHLAPAAIRRFLDGMSRLLL